MSGTKLAGPDVPWRHTDDGPPPLPFVEHATPGHAPERDPEEDRARWLDALERRHEDRHLAFKVRGEPTPSAEDEPGQVGPDSA